VIVARDVQKIALTLEHEAGTLEVRPDPRGVDPMQLIHDDARVARLADEVDDTDDAAGFHGAIESGEHVFRIDVRRAGLRVLPVDVVIHHVQQHEIEEVWREGIGPQGRRRAP
jgi:hypothetical protein